MKAVILAAGKGVRMRSERPKVLFSVAGRTLLERVIRSALELSPKQIVVVVGFREELVRAECERLKTSGIVPASVDLSCVTQTEQKGTGHAVLSAAPLLGATESENVLILPGDCPLVSGEDLKYFALRHTESKAVLSVVTAKVPDPAGFGRIIRGKHGELLAIVEKKDCSEAQLPIDEINAAIYVSELGFLRESLKSLTPNNAQGEYYLTDIVGYAVKNKIPAAGIQVQDYRSVLGANDRAELSELESIRRAAINRDAMLGGATLEDPSQTYIDEGISIGSDTFIGAGVWLQGKTAIGSRAVIEGNCRIVDSTIAEDALVKFSSHLEGATVGSKSFVGPFARLRQGTTLHEGVHVGNFVETKNTEFHPGAKANHVSYLGDSSIGAASNIGAGTIFCNYDGEKKSKTVVGDKVFVGSHSTLVAPVELESETYIAAGSVITEKVPSGSLGIGRSRQTNKDGWMKRREAQKKGK